ncbi:Anthocyanidin 3-O-glucosyltransferase 2 [Platanthera guangdongensis]|uniref:Glycosyltransferase n=1 Tax=Platanthera guangdongensis TaxID=2320717 RepID=A0ABR2LXG8_9ASPA
MSTAGGGESSSQAPPVQHIALLAFPFGTLVAQLHMLARALASAVPEAIFSFVSNAENLVPLPHSSGGNLRLVPFQGGIENGGCSTTLFDRIMAVAPEKIRAMLDLAEVNAGGVPVSCVMTDAFAWITESVSKENGLPWVALHSGFSLAMLAHIHAGDLRSRLGFASEGMPDRAQETLDFIPGLDSMRICDLPDGIISGDRNGEFSIHLQGMAQTLPGAAVVLLPSVPADFLEQDSGIFADLNLALLIGPLNLLSPPPPSPDPEGCIQWLRDRPPLSVVYISFGIVATLPPGELTELARGLEDSHVSFLWSLKAEQRSCLPAGFVERTQGRGKLVNWAPQVSVLGHPSVVVFVTHCGWNSALESISAGVPMLCRPIFGDQRMVARALEEIWGVGAEFVGPITRISFMIAMEGIMTGIIGPKMREWTQELRQRTMEAMFPGGGLFRNFNVLVNLIRGR